MSLVWLVLVSVISTIFTQSITSLLATNAQLSSDQIKNLPHFSAYLDGLVDVTFLAPSNDALSTFFDSARGIAASSDPALLEAILTYHIQNGTWYQPTDTAGSGIPHFIGTKLSSSQYTNVTNGQYVEGVNDVTGTGLIYSGLGVTSKIITPVCFSKGRLRLACNIYTEPEHYQRSNACNRYSLNDSTRRFHNGYDCRPDGV